MPPKYGNQKRNPAQAKKQGKILQAPKPKKPKGK